MHSTMRSKSSFIWLLLLVLVAAVAFTGCKGSDGAQGPAGQNGQTGANGPTGPSGPTGPQGPHGTFSNNNCIDCHHMSDQAIAMGIPIRPHENGGSPLVIGVTQNNVASFKTATAGTPVGLTVKSQFTWVEESTGATNTVNVAGVYWQYMDGLPSTVTGAVTSPTITVTIPAGLDYRQQLVDMAVNPGTSWDTNRYRVVPINDTNMGLATESRYLLTVFGDDGKVYWDLIGVKASDAVTDTAKYAPVHTTGEPVVPINLPVLVTAKTTSITSPMSWSLAAPAGSSASLSGASDTYPYFTPDQTGTYTVTDNNTGATIKVYAGTWRGVIVGAPTGTDPLLPAKYDTNCNGCHNVTDNPLTAWSGNIGAAPDKFASWSKTGHAKRFTEGLDESGPEEKYNATCFPCHTVGFVGTAKNNGGFHDQPNYDAFITNVITPALTSTAPDMTRYATAWSSGTYTLLLQRSNIQCEQCHGPQNNTGAHGAAGAPIAGTRESLDANMCGLCHGAATHHTRYQTWKDSPTGHSNYDLARNEGTNPSCAACHSGQGNLIYIKQLVNGNPLRTIPSGSITWTADTVQPQTCAVCHDPHNVGRDSDDAYFTPEQVFNSSQTRLSLLMAAAGLNPGDTPKLPAGFKATGVGKGGQCIICHNSRNGGSGSDAYLHEDNDPVFGALTGYAAPHAANQGDVVMGHNAYFVESSGGDLSLQRGAHSTLPDTCVTCHMEKTPPLYTWTENAHGTNHTFKADLGICNECHGVDSGLGPKLQMDTMTQLDQVRVAIQDAVISQATGTYKGNIASVALTTSHGSPALNLTYLDATPAANGVNPNAVVPVVSAAGQTLAKAMWNYNLISNDGSKGVHNPNFVRKVLGNTYDQLSKL